MINLNNPYISIVLPTYQGQKTVGSTIKSLQNQSFKNFELIIIDDCSTDKTSDVINSFLKNDPRIRFIQHKKNIGLASTLNEGILLSRSNLIARIDQDDEAMPDRLKIQYSFMNKNKKVAVAGSFVYLMGRDKKFDKMLSFPTDSKAIRSELIKSNCIFHPSVIMRKKSVVNIGGYRKAYKNAEDYDLWLRLSKSESICNIPLPLIRYRFSIDGMTLGKKWEQLFYVYLAQTSYQYPKLNLYEVKKIAKNKLKNTDRKEFFSYVIQGTLAELKDLKMWRSYFKLIKSLSIKELGIFRTLEIVYGNIR